MIQSNMQDNVQEIKDRIDIVDFLKTYLSLSPAGKNFKALCPFHKEKTPSFIVSPDRQIWHCFGCNSGGDIIGFLMRYENIEFIEALKILAEKAGIDLKHSGSFDQRQYAVLYEINQAAKEFFKNNLASSELVKNYLIERGLKKETIEEFEIGAALNTSDVLTRHLLKSGFNISDVERSGLIFKTDRGTYWDRFRNRIIFPLHNNFGKVIGFTGRILPEKQINAEGPRESASSPRESASSPRESAFTASAAKYINSPETPIFSKSKLLFGFHKTKEAIRESKTAILVEGQMDFLMAYQDGIRNVVATSGTALTNDHLKILKRLADNLILCFDSDEAGRTASERSIDLAEANDFSVKVLELNYEGLKDPADIVKNKPGLLYSLINNAQPAMEFYFSRYLSNADLRRLDADIHGQDIHLKKKNIRIVLSKIKNILSPVVKDHWIKELSRRTAIDERSLLEELEGLKISLSKTSIEEQKESQRDLSRIDIICQRIIALALADNKFSEILRDNQNYLPNLYRSLFIFSIDKKNPDLSPPLKQVSDLINLRSSLDFEKIDKKKAESEFNDLLKQLKREYFKENQRIVIQKIKKAEKEGSEEELREILKEFDNLSREMQKL
jgi:DNA primase